MYKFIFLLIIVGITYAGTSEYKSNQISNEGSYRVNEQKHRNKNTYDDNRYEHDATPMEYKFNYEVNDPKTGDVKSHHEKLQGKQVTGQYTINDSDGYRRIVDYIADDEHGFRATVRREPIKENRQSEYNYYQDPQNNYVHKHQKENQINSPENSHDGVEYKFIIIPKSNKYNSIGLPVKYTTLTPELKYTADESPKYIHLQNKPSLVNQILRYDYPKLHNGQQMLYNTQNYGY